MAAISAVVRPAATSATRARTTRTNSAVPATPVVDAADEDGDRDDDRDDDDADCDENCEGGVLVTLADVGTAAAVDDAVPSDPDVVHAAVNPTVTSVASATTKARTGDSSDPTPDRPRRSAARGRRRIAGTGPSAAHGPVGGTLSCPRRRAG